MVKKCADTRGIIEEIIGEENIPNSVKTHLLKEIKRISSSQDDKGDLVEAWFKYSNGSVKKADNGIFLTVNENRIKLPGGQGYANLDSLEVMIYNTSNDRAIETLKNVTESLENEKKKSTMIDELKNRIFNGDMSLNELDDLIDFSEVKSLSDLKQQMVDAILSKK